MLEINNFGGTDELLGALPPAAAALHSELRRLINFPHFRVFALVDGAQFEDLPGELARNSIAHRSLYRNVQDAELVRAGPWLVDLYHYPDPGLNAWGGLPPPDGMAANQASHETEEPLRLADGGSWQQQNSFHATGGQANPEAQLLALMRIVAGGPAAVFWIGDSMLSEPAIWRHLRTLNMALIPIEFAGGSSLEQSQLQERPIDPGVESATTHEAVMFRHADGNVLAEILPVLDEAQFSRFFGPAKSVLFLAPGRQSADRAPVRRAAMPVNAPPAAAGLLKLSTEQFTLLSDARMSASNQSALDYVMRSTQTIRSSYSVGVVQHLVGEALEKADGVGADTQLSRCHWALIYTLSEGNIYNSPRFHAYNRLENLHQDREQRFYEIIRGIVGNPV